jgi:hypothetical protein
MDEQVQAVTPAESQQTPITSADLAKQIELLTQEKEKSEVVQTPEKKEEVKETPQVVEPPKVELSKTETPLEVEKLVVKPTQPVQQPTPSQPLNSLDDYNNWLREQMAVNPAEAIASVARLINKPHEESLRNNQLEKEIVKLSRTLPDFNNESVKGEMIKVVQENPSRYCDEYGIPKPEYMKDIFYIAKGRTNVIPSVNNVVVNPVPVEGRTKATQSQVMDFNKMSLDEKEAYIASLNK